MQRNRAHLRLGATSSCVLKLLLGLTMLYMATPLPLDCSDPEASGRTFQEQGLWEQAASEYQRALDECGQDAGVYNSLGQALWQLGLPEQALPAFKQAVELDPHNPFMVYNLGSLLHWEGQDLTAAEIALEKAAQLGKEQGGNELLAKYAARARERCREAAALRIKREKIELEIGEEPLDEVRNLASQPSWQEKVADEASGKISGADFYKSVGPIRGHVVPVDERHVDELSYDEFMREYALKSRPVVLRGLANRITRDGTLWDVQTIVQTCGSHTITPRVFDKSSTKWAGLEDQPPVSVKDFMSEFQSNPDSKGYLFDWGLPKSCTDLLADFVVPKYFAGDYLQSLPVSNRDPATGVDSPPRLYADSWPSLFVGPAHSGGGLHIDSFGSNFWMSVLSGRKLWQFFDEAALPFLYPSHQDQSFGVDTREPDYGRYPLYAFANSSVCVVGPGDGLFVPAGSPHQVTNLSPSMAISMNYVDSSNIEKALRVTHLEGLADPDSAYVHNQLAEVHEGKLKGDEGSGLEGQDLAWLKFKSR